MANTQLGIVSPTPNGDWIAGATYQKLSIVRSGNASYQAKTSNTNIEPGVTSGWQTYWMLLNEDGTQGEPGPQGEPGVGVPTGGLAGQVLAKSTNNNYDTEWIPQIQIEAGSAVNDGNGNNIAQTYETKQHAQETFQTKTDSTVQQTTLQNQITTNRQLISRNSHRLDGLEQRIKPSPFITDSTIAYQKDVPSNAVGAAEIKIIGGMTYRDQNTIALTSSKSTKVESVGANIFGGDTLKDKFKAEMANATVNTTDKTISYYAREADGKTFFTDFKPNTQYTFIFKGAGTSLAFLNMSLVYTDGTRVEYWKFNGSDVLSTFRFVSDPSKSIKSLIGAYYDGQTTLYYDECGIFEGVLTADDFKPYVKHTLPIPEAVQALDGYGEGIPDTEYYNSIVWNEDGTVSYRRKAKRIILDGVTYPALQVVKYDTLYTLVFAAGNTVPNTKVLAVGYNSSVNDYNADTNIFINPNNYILVTLSDQTITTPAAANAYLQQHPIKCIVSQKESVTDISDLITADNMLSVEGNGTLTFENEYGYAVPSIVEYITAEATA